MASFGSPPTLFQSAAAALSTPHPAATRDAEEIYRNAVENVRQKPRHQNLEQVMIDRITTARTIAELAQIAGTNISQHKFWKVDASWKRSQVVDTFNRFKESLDLYAQAGGSIALPIYATIHLIAQIVTEVLGAHAGLSTYCEHIAYLHNQYMQYILGGGFETPLRDALTKIYETIIEFCLEAFSLLSKNCTGILLRIISKSLKEPFDDLLNKLAKARSDVDSAVLGESYHDGKLVKRTLANPQLVKRVGSGTNIAHVPIGVPALLSRHFTGRSQELKRTRHHLTAKATIGPTRAAICGLPGIGKTQLTLQYLQQYANTSGRGIFVNASSKDMIVSAYRTIASTLDLLDVRIASNDLVIEKVKYWLAENHNWLLIFDNVSYASDVLHFTPITGQGQILFTTRSKVTATTLAAPEACIELQPLSQEEGEELALAIMFGGASNLSQDATAARGVADLTSGLPLAVEQLACLSKSKGLSLSDTLNLVQKRVQILRLDHPAPLNAGNLSCGALLIETLEEVRRKNEGAAALFTLLTYLEPSHVPLQILFDVPLTLRAHFDRHDTYDRGAGRIPPAPRKPNVSQQKASFFEDNDPFDRDTWKKIFHLGHHKRMYTNATLPRIDSEEDKRLQAYWESHRSLKLVFADHTSIDHALNILAEAGLVRRLYQSNALWIHDLYADMSQEIDQVNGASSCRNVTAHLATTMVCLSFPVPRIPAPFHILDKCLLLLPSALRCLNSLLEAGILNDATIGAELSHLIASAIHSRGMMMADLRAASLPEAIKFYKLATHGYVCAFRRLSAYPKVSPLQIILATVFDQADEEIHHRYLSQLYLHDYERFGRSAAWRAVQTALKLVLLLLDGGQLDESLRFATLGVELTRALFGANHDETVDALGLLLQVREAREDWYASYDVAWRVIKAFGGYDDATGIFRSGQTLLSTLQGASYCSGMGNAARRLERYKEAEEWYERAVVALVCRFGDGGPEVEFARRKVARMRLQRELIEYLET